MRVGSYSPEEMELRVGATSSSGRATRLPPLRVTSSKDVTAMVPRGLATSRAVISLADNSVTRPSARKVMHLSRRKPASKIMRIWRTGRQPDSSTVSSNNSRKPLPLDRQDEADLLIRQAAGELRPDDGAVRIEATLAGGFGGQRLIDLAGGQGRLRVAPPYGEHHRAEAQTQFDRFLDAVGAAQFARGGRHAPRRHQHVRHCHADPGAEQRDGARRSERLDLGRWRFRVALKEALRHQRRDAFGIGGRHDGQAVAQDAGPGLRLRAGRPSVPRAAQQRGQASARSAEVIRITLAARCRRAGRGLPPAAIAPPRRCARICASQPASSVCWSSSRVATSASAPGNSPRRRCSRMLASEVSTRPRFDRRDQADRPTGSSAPRPSLVAGSPSPRVARDAISRRQHFEAFGQVARRRQAAGGVAAQHFKIELRHHRRPVQREDELPFARPGTPGADHRLQMQHASARRSAWRPPRPGVRDQPSSRRRDLLERRAWIGVRPRRVSATKRGTTRQHGLPLPGVRHNQQAAAPTSAAPAASRRQGLRRCGTAIHRPVPGRWLRDQVRVCFMLRRPGALPAIVGGVIPVGPLSPGSGLCRVNGRRGLRANYLASQQ